MKVGIIGAGIIGLSIGWYLSKEGIDVTIFEKNEAGKGATWASAGMLAARSEIEPGEEYLLQLLIDSKNLWPSFAEELIQESKIDIGYRKEGTILIALDYDDASKLKSHYNYLKKIGIDVEILSSEKILEIEPFLNPNLIMGLYSKEDHQVDNRLVTLALKEAFIKSGGILKERTEVKKVVITNDEIEGIIAKDEFYKFDFVILSAGAWSPLIEGIPKHVIPPVRPVKGQALSIQMDPSNPIIKHVIWGPEAYLVPKNDGRLVVGATVEEVGFDNNITVSAVYSLLKACWEMVPSISEFPIKEIWSGFRPGSRDDAPILGPTRIKGLIMATGHHRNGILLAPITAKGITEFIVKGVLPSYIKRFTLDRFNTSWNEYKS